ncbi:MAG: 1-deoxy-D-xylulose-5-phosphate reductoisomerase, partial [Phycisphaerales bacterium]
MVKQIAILGSTGSIGRNAIEVIDALGPGYRIFALTAHSNVQLLADQVRRYRPRFVAVTDSDRAPELGEMLADLDVEILVGPDALTTIAQIDEVDVVLAAVVGAAGLPALLAAARKGK